MGKLFRALPVPAGLSLEQHSAVTQHLVSEFLAEVAEDEWRLTSRPRLSLGRQVVPFDVELDDGTRRPLPDVLLWTVEADAER